MTESRTKSSFSSTNYIQKERTSSTTSSQKQSADLARSSAIWPRKSSRISLKTWCNISRRTSRSRPLSRSFAKRLRIQAMKLNGETPRSVFPSSNWMIRPSSSCWNFMTVTRSDSSNQPRLKSTSFRLSPLARSYWSQRWSNILKISNLKSIWTKTQC